MMAFAIKKSDKIIPDAYHGTDYDTAEKIVSNKEFVPSIGDEHYLGDGVYFFESSLWHAKDWAQKSTKKKSLKTLGVIKAKIDLGRCLDLNDFNCRMYIKSVATEFISRGIDTITEGVVINFIAKQTGIDTIRANYVVPEKGPIFKDSRFFNYSCLMICVRNTKSISGIAWAYTGVII